MAFSVACADMGVDCPGSFTTESKAELMEHATIHLKSAHSDIELNDETMAEVAGIVKTV
jgi:predicted small metal-binding protein|tara:strand:- start:173 stop:349 length:177 start_codon:yes stop_codon:yes gene_type:complete